MKVNIYAKCFRVHISYIRTPSELKTTNMLAAQSSVNCVGVQMRIEIKLWTSILKRKDSRENVLSLILMVGALLIVQKLICSLIFTQSKTKQRFRKMMSLKMRDQLTQILAWQQGIAN